MQRTTRSGRRPARRRWPRDAAQANVSPFAIGERPKSPSIVPSPRCTMPTVEASVVDVHLVRRPRGGWRRRSRSTSALSRRTSRLPVRSHDRRSLSGPCEGGGPVGRRVVDHVECHLPAQAHRGAVVVGPRGLRDDDVVARLLHLDERDARPEVVGHAGMRDVDLARLHARCGGASTADAARSRRRDRVGESLAVDALGEADPGVRRLDAVARRLEQDPAFGLAERGAEVAAGPLPGSGGHGGAPGRPGRGA